MQSSRGMIWLSLAVIFSLAWGLSPRQLAYPWGSPGIIKRVDNNYWTDATQQITPTPQGVLMPDLTPTPFPREFLENARMTTGIAIGAALLVLIVVGGTLWSISRKDEK